mmetsp:Transcript_17530/g.25942  ORF Transcript_17530/g.25942 Transcript_17530/m.25942 type:complete len:205 (+) Transcript_17530:75-689(+)|eukprot:CAMPEP_0194209674 /NCGR_PEP_ID=MMETSP0156-20130528/7713_1 /TAXON_ID=33649 /ORGANISM="Thalassionema nitzschioides, Strain L26-B" /LENGTH=204 /DNA_ID=CAMNT_0038936877 /DNA_START=92 /DNA_END=706 /DNA_ORIENTATION=+
MTRPKNWFLRCAFCHGKIGRDNNKNILKGNPVDNNSVGTEDSDNFFEHEAQEHAVERLNRRHEYAERIIEDYRISMEMVPIFYEWILDQNAITAEKKGKQFARCGAIDATKTFTFFNGIVQVDHCETKQVLDLGPSSFSVVDSLMTNAQKKKFRSWLDGDLFDDEVNALPLGDLSKHLKISITSASRGTAIRVLSPTTGRSIDL